MKKQLWLLALVSTVLLSVVPAWAQEFYVIAAGPTAVGTKITSLPYTISSPGFYYLTGNLSYAGASGGIAISSDDVTLDLMGFRLSGPGSNGSNIGISMFGRQNVEIRNGTLGGWWVGVYEAGNGARALNLRVENSVVGISFNGGQCLVKGCTVEATPGGTGTGIYLQGGTASGNIVSNSGVGIVLGGTGGNVIGNSVVIPSGSTGIRIDTNDPVLVDQNTVTGTVSGAGTRFSPGTGTIKTTNNAGF